MTAAFQHLLQQLQDNIRLRFGFWAILFVGLLYLALLLKGHNGELEAKYLDQADKLHRLDNIMVGRKWQERAESVKNIWADELKRLPLIKSQGVTRAGVENNLNRILTAAGIAKPRLHIDEFRAVEKLPGIVQLTARIEGEFVPEQLVKLIYELENPEQRGHLVKLQVIRGSNSSFEVVYALYFQDNSPTGEQGDS